MPGAGQRSDRSSTGLSTDHVDVSNFPHDRDDLTKITPNLSETNSVSSCMVNRSKAHQFCDAFTHLVSQSLSRIPADPTSGTALCGRRSGVGIEQASASKMPHAHDPTPRCITLYAPADQDVGDVSAGPRQERQHRAP